MKIAFIDRDGTINRDYPDEMWTNIKEPEILKGAIEGLQYLIKKGYQLILITNQYTIGEGIITPVQYESFQEKLLNILKHHEVHFLDVFFCPHARNSGCACCKPKDGMITQALQKYPEIELCQSIYIGDSLADYQLAESLSIPFYGIQLNCKQPIHSIEDIKNYL